MTSEDLHVLAKVEAARVPSDIFDGKDNEKLYKRLLKRIHPDKFPVAQRPRADAAARHLGALFSEVKGNSSTVVTPLFCVDGWTATREFSEGHIAKLYLAKHDRTGELGLLKVVNHPSDKDLLEAEASTLKTVLSLSEMYGSVKLYLPKFLEAFAVDAKTVNSFSYTPGKISLFGIQAQMSDRKIPFRHIVWMGNRIWSLLGWVHRCGYVHGGITPSHLLYAPADHGLLLVGWGSSVRIQENHIPVIDPTWETYYPAEVKRKSLATSATDIYMTMKSLIDSADVVPREFLPLVDHCLAGSPAARPLDAWKVADRWAGAARVVYGEPKFVELKISVV